MVRGLLQDKKGPGTSTGNRVTAAPGPHPLGLLQDSWERAGLTAPSPAKQGLSSTKRDLVALSRREGNKDEVVNPQRLWALAGESLRVENWAMWDPDPDSPRPSWRGGLCERIGPSLYSGSHRIEQEDFPKKKKTLRALWGIPL